MIIRRPQHRSIRRIRFRTLCLSHTRPQHLLQLRHFHLQFLHALLQLGSIRRTLRVAAALLREPHTRTPRLQRKHAHRDRHRVLPAHYPKTLALLIFCACSHGYPPSLVTSLPVNPIPIPTPPRYSPSQRQENFSSGDREGCAMGPRSYLSVLPCLAVLALFAALFSRTVLPLRAQNAATTHPPQTEFVATPSPERLARGRYLVTGVAHCFGCHGEPDFKNLASQPKPGTEGAGDLPKDESFNDVPIEPVLPHPNLTPDKETGAGTWTDAQFERAIRHGIGHDGRILTGDMPYAFFRSMTDEDVSSVIVYLRSLPPVHHVLPQRKLPYTPKVDFQPEMEPAIPPNATDQVKHGWYLVRIAQCNDCHSPYDKDGDVLPGKMFGGGLTMTGAWGTVVSANITPDPSGIAHYDTAMFI